MKTEDEAGLLLNAVVRRLRRKPEDRILIGLVAALAWVLDRPEGPVNDALDRLVEES